MKRAFLPAVALASMLAAQQEAQQETQQETQQDPQQDLEQAPAGYDAQEACAALAARADRGELAVPDALRVLGAAPYREAEARTVAAIVRASASR